MKRLIPGALIILNLMALPLHAQDLLSVYSEALIDNPQVERAREGLEAVLENRSQAQAALI